VESLAGKTSAMVPPTTSCLRRGAAAREAGVGGGGGGREKGSGAAGDPGRWARTGGRGRCEEARNDEESRAGAKRRGAGVGAAHSLAGPTLTGSRAPGARAFYSGRQRRPVAAPPTAHAPSARAREPEWRRGRGRASRSGGARGAGRARSELARSCAEPAGRGHWGNRRLRAGGAVGGTGGEGDSGSHGPRRASQSLRAEEETGRGGSVLLRCLFLFLPFPPLPPPGSPPSLFSSSSSARLARPPPLPTFLLPLPLSPARLSPPGSFLLSGIEVPRHPCLPQRNPSPRKGPWVLPSGPSPHLCARTAGGSLPNFLNTLIFPGHDAHVLSACTGLRFYLAKSPSNRVCQNA
jgi:hypothetical protein